ncbi:MAG: hypothetical protein ABR571_07970 [Jatrophihabitans sp.]|uniref:hypothetical protein n=1 Tax=Jatrophihabitans sp. TaxID=1932789 RepID=UPI00390D0783
MTTQSATSIAFAIPVLPGQTDLDRRTMHSCWHGERSGQHAASRRRHGITRESVWIQATPDGDVVVVVIEAHDIAAALAGLADSDSEFDSWFREHIRIVHGIDLQAGLAPTEQVLDYRAAQSAG